MRSRGTLRIAVLLCAASIILPGVAAAQSAQERQREEQERERQEQQREEQERQRQERQEQDRQRQEEERRQEQDRQRQEQAREQEQTRQQEQMRQQEQTRQQEQVRQQEPTRQQEQARQQDPPRQDQARVEEEHHRREGGREHREHEHRENDREAARIAEDVARGIEQVGNQVGSQVSRESGPARAPDGWVGAYDPGGSGYLEAPPSTSSFYWIGVATNRGGSWVTRSALTRADAELAALNACNHMFGQCSILSAFSGEQRTCFALEQTKFGVGSFSQTNGTPDTVRTEALAGCARAGNPNCPILVAACNDRPAPSPYYWIGMAWNQAGGWATRPGDDRDVAQARALDACNFTGGHCTNTDPLPGTSRGCFAIAKNSANVLYSVRNTAGNLQAAVDEAMRTCQNGGGQGCQPAASACNDRPPPTPFALMSVAWNANGAWAVRRGNRIEAPASALDACNGSAGQCVNGPQVSGDTRGCFAIARSGTRVFLDQKPDIRAAQQAAIQLCQTTMGNAACQMQASGCNDLSPGARIPPGTARLACGMAVAAGTSAQYQVDAVPGEGLVCPVRCMQGTIAAARVTYATNCHPSECPLATGSCVGRASCAISPSNAVCGGDPCPNVPKGSVISVSCTAGP
jgi:Domain of unknown function (DUF4189)